MKGSYRRFIFFEVVAISTFAAVSSAAAQAATSPRPAYQQMRFDERWGARLAGSSHWADPLKHVPLARDDRAWVTFAGQLRARAEHARGFQLGSTPASDDDFSLWRITASADLHVATSASWPSPRIFVEGRNAHAIGRTLPGGTRPQDEDHWDAQNAFADLQWKNLLLRAGIQEFSIGRERLVGLSDWANARRGFSGTRAILRHGRLSIDAFSGRPLDINSRAHNRPDSSARFHALVAGTPAGSWTRGFAWQASWLLQEVSAPTAAERRTVAVRAQWRPLQRPLGAAWTVEYEGGIQGGRIGNRALRAWYSVSDVTAAFTALPGSPVVTTGVDAASGDGNPADHTIRSFQVLYPTPHMHGGNADLVGRANVRTVRAAVAGDPLRWLQLRVDGYDWRRLDPADGIYTKTGGVLRAATGSPALDVGREVDLTGIISVSRQLKLLGGVAHVFPGRFLSTTPGGAPPVDWAFAGTTFTW